MSQFALPHAELKSALAGLSKVISRRSQVVGATRARGGAVVFQSQIGNRKSPSAMTRAEFDRLSRDPGNWFLGFLYFCPADPRVLVPKRIRGFGWTLNFARPLALPYLFLLVTAVGLVVDVARRLG